MQFQGVISGLDWNAERKELCSVSDDRSIRIHKMDLQGDVFDFESWRKCEFKSGLVLFGHTARVWRAKLLEEVIVSIAEVCKRNLNYIDCVLDDL